ncbi:MAG: hypothetical protein HY721_05915 [Planctomycetes bacterium]|nr:hypothetical protein [Planctomycetota bacterium]
MIAIVVVALVLAGFSAASRKPSSTAATGTTELERPVSPALSEVAVTAATGAEPVAGREEKPPPQLREKLVEELMAEAGEDRGAVYAMNRVREALREGNHAFARRLFATMKAEHGESVLLKAAEDLIQGGE